LQGGPDSIALVVVPLPGRPDSETASTLAGAASESMDFVVDHDDPMTCNRDSDSRMNSYLFIQIHHVWKT
jgi:hypothetical protein